MFLTFNLCLSLQRLIFRLVSTKIKIKKIKTKSLSCLNLYKVNSSVIALTRVIYFLTFLTFNHHSLQGLIFRLVIQNKNKNKNKNENNNSLLSKRVQSMYKVNSSVFAFTPSIYFLIYFFFGLPRQRFPEFCNWKRIETS